MKYESKGVTLYPLFKHIPKISRGMAKISTSILVRLAAFCISEDRHTSCCGPVGLSPSACSGAELATA